MASTDRSRLQPADDAHAALRAIADRSERSKSDGNGGHMVTCGCHDDRDPSLHVWVDETGRLANHCFAGCEQARTTAYLQGLVGTSLTLSSDDDAWTPAGPAIARSPYTDENGRELFAVYRTADKEFPVSRPDPMSKSGRRWQVKGHVRPVLYRLPELIAGVMASKVVDLTDGEKDAEAVVRVGGVATTLPHWAGDFRKNPEYTEFFRGAHVRVHRDRDGGQGARQAAAAVAALTGVAASLTVVEAAVGKDASDHLAAGKTLAELHVVDEHQSEGAEAVPAESSRFAPEVFLDWSTIWQARREGEEWLYPDILARHRSHVIYAKRKDGKSLLTLFLAAKLATSDEPIVVIYLDYEMTIEDLLERLEDMGYGPSSDLSRFYYDLLPTLPPLDTETGGEALIATIDRVCLERPGCEILLVVDTTSRAVRGPGERVRHLSRPLRLQRHRAQTAQDHLGPTRPRRQGPAGRTARLLGEGRRCRRRLEARQDPQRPAAQARPGAHELGPRAGQPGYGGGTPALPARSRQLAAGHRRGRRDPRPPRRAPKRRSPDGRAGAQEHR